MSLRLSPALAAALALWLGASPPAEAQPKKPDPKAQKAPAKPAPAKPGAKAAPKAPAKAPAKKGGPKKGTRAAAPAAPDDAARRAIAGSAAVRSPRESAELAALREADEQLFPRATGPRKSPLVAEGSLLVDAGRPSVVASGLPPAGLSSALLDEVDRKAQKPTTGWLKELSLPEIPIRWDERVVRYLEYYKNDPKGRGMVATWVKRSGRYGGMIRRVLREQRLPEDILWLALVESAFEPTALSPAGAAGLWQFMPEGARIYGLEVGRWVDERLDPERSTLAAARYLSDLHKRFGTWELAFAAYNMGYGGLLSAIKKYNTNDFWELSKVEAGVPYETALYAPKILAMAIVAKNCSVFGCADVELDPAVTFDEVKVAGAIPLRVVATAAGAAPSDVDNLNPQYLAGRSPPPAPSAADDAKWVVRVPAGMGQRAARGLSAQLAKEPKLARHTLRWGESLADVAARRGATRAALEQLNGVRTGEAVRPGTVLLVPAGAPPAAPPAPAVVVVPHRELPREGKRRVFYRVSAGDTLAELATVLSVGEAELRRWNALDAKANLQEGMTLQALLPEAKRPADVILFEERDVRVLTRGTPEFFDWYEAQKGRKRVVVKAKAGDTWRSLARRYGLSLGQLERINQRARTSELRDGDQVVVYVPLGKAPKAEEPARGVITQAAPAKPEIPEDEDEVDEPEAQKPGGAKAAEPKAPEKPAEPKPGEPKAPEKPAEPKAPEKPAEPKAPEKPAEPKPAAPAPGGKLLELW